MQELLDASPINGNQLPEAVELTPDEQEKWANLVEKIDTATPPEVKELIRMAPQNRRPGNEVGREWS